MCPYTVLINNTGTLLLVPVDCELFLKTRSLFCLYTSLPQQFFLCDTNVTDNLDRFIFKKETELQR
jgi:hypothetical protein